MNLLLPEMALPALHGATLSTRLSNGPRPGDLPVIGTTHLTFDAANLNERVPGLSFGPTDLVLPAPGAEARITSQGRYRNTPFALEAKLAVPTHADGPVTVPFDLAVHAKAGAPAKLVLKGKLGLKTFRFARMDAAVDLQTPALADLRPVLGPRVPALTDVALTGTVSIPADKPTLQLKAARLSTEQGDLEGEGQFSFGPEFAMSGHWASNRLDLDALLDAFGIRLAAPSAPPTAGGPGVPAIPLPWASLHGTRVDLTGSAAKLSVSGENWRNVQFALRLQNDSLQVGPIKAASPAGPIEFSLTADAATRPGLVNLSLQAPAVPFSELARHFALPGTVGGTARITARLSGRGDTLRALAASLTGSVSSVAVNGAMTNAAFKRLAGPALDALGITVPQDGETKLRCLGLAGRFENGVGAFPTIALETTYLSLEGVGRVDLARETVALKLAPLAALAGSHVAVPVIVEGPFADIKARLDATGLEQLGLFVDALFGGDTATACAHAGLTSPP